MHVKKGSSERKVLKNNDLYFSTLNKQRLAAVFCAILMGSVFTLLPTDSEGEEPSSLAVAMKQTKKTTIVSVRNNGEAPIYSVELENPDGKIRFVKVKAWNRERIDDSTVVVKTDDKPISTGKSLIILILTDNRSSILLWNVRDSFGSILASGTVTERAKQAVEEPPKEEVALPPEEEKMRVEGEYEVIIVGAGIAGLSAGYELRDQNIKILEKNSYVGGRTVAGEYKGFTYAKGTEYLGIPEGKFASMLREIGAEPVEVPYPTDAIYYNGELHIGENEIAQLYFKHECPCTGKSKLEQYNLFLRAFLDLQRLYENEGRLDEELKRLDRTSLKDFFDSLGLDQFYYDRFDLLVRGIFGAGISEVSTLVAAPEIAYEFEGATAISNEEDVYEEEDTTSTDVYSFKRGITEVIEKLVKVLDNKIQTDSTVASVDKTNDGKLIVSYKDKEGTLHLLKAKVVIMATPAPITKNIAANVLDKEVLDRLEWFEYSPYITVNLFSDEPIFDKAFAISVFDAFFTDLYDSTWVQRHYLPGLKAEPVSITGLYIPAESYKDRSILELTDEEILKKIYADLDRIFPSASIKVKGYDIHRFDYAYPVIKPGFYENVIELNELNDGSVLLAGDYMSYPNFDIAAETGFNAAELSKKVLMN